ncbi:hypothetical protein Tco_0815822 [Tanacetum coccineum]
MDSTNIIFKRVTRFIPILRAKWFGSKVLRPLSPKTPVPRVPNEMGSLRYQDAPVVDEGGQAVPAPVQAPQQPPPPPTTAARTMPQRLGRLEDEMQGLRQDVKSLHGLLERSMTDLGRFFTWIISCIAQLMEVSGLTYQAFDGTFRGSSPVAFQRCTRQRTSEASNSIVQQDPQQPDP